MPLKNAPLQTGPGGIPLVEPTADIFAEKEGQLGAGIRPTFWGKFWSEVALNLHDAPIGLGVPISQDDPGSAFSRMLDQFRVTQQAKTNGSAKLSPEDANKQFPGLEKPFSEPVYPEVAKLIYDEQQRVKKQQAWINRGPETGPLFDLAASLPVGLDPFNLVVGSLLPVAKGASLLGNIGRRFATDFAVNAIGEVPGIVQKSQEQKELPSAGDVVVSAGVGAVAGTAFHTTMDLALRRGAEIVSQKPKALVHETVKSAIELHESGQKIDVTPSATLHEVREIGHVAQGIENPYEFRQLNHPSEVQYYVSIDPETGNVKSIEDLGGGIVGVDNKAVANNAAGVPESAFNGKVVRAELSKDSNLLEIETPVKDLFGGVGREKALEKIQGILGLDDRRLSQYRDRFRKLWTDKGTVRDLFNLFQNAATDRIRAFNDIPANDFRNLLDGMGYDGLKFNKLVDGVPVDNRIMVFNHEKLSPVEVAEASKAEVPQFTQEQQHGASQKAMAPEKERFHDEEAQIVAKEKSTMNDSKVNSEEIKTRFTAEEENVRARLKELASNPENEHITKAIEEIEAAYQADQYEIEAAKNLAKCIEGAVV